MLPIATCPECGCDADRREPHWSSYREEIRSRYWYMCRGCRQFFVWPPIDEVSRSISRRIKSA